MCMYEQAISIVFIYMLSRISDTISSYFVGVAESKSWLWNKIKIGKYLFGMVIVRQCISRQKLMPIVDSGVKVYSRYVGASLEFSFLLRSLSPDFSMFYLLYELMIIRLFS